MKLNFDITIDADLDSVWTAFTNPQNRGRWQTNFHACEHMTGEPGQPGATAKLTFDEKGKMVLLTETITERSDRSFIASTYESLHGTTMIVNRFEDIDAKETRWTSWHRISFKGIMKVMSLFVGGIIRKRTEADMQRFKLMVETDEAQSP